MSKKLVEMHQSSANIYADLGLPDADEMLEKSEIVIQLRLAIEARKLMPAAAAEQIGISEAELSQIMRGSFRLLHMGRLRQMLAAIAM